MHVNFASRSSSEIKLNPVYWPGIEIRNSCHVVPGTPREPPVKDVRYPVAVRLRSLLPLTSHSITSPPSNVNGTLYISALSQSKWLIEFQRSEEEATTAHSR